MTMTHEEKLAYGRGYNAGVRGGWPMHRPPVPTQEDVRDLMVAAQALRDAVDGQLAVFDPDDPIEAILGPPLDDVTGAMEKIGQWLLESAD